MRSVLVEVFVEELAKDAELRRAIVHRIAGEVATKRDLEELRKELEARVGAVEQGLRRELRDVEARLHERFDRLQAQLNERIDRLHERIDAMVRWVIAFLATTWAAIAAMIVKLLL